MLADVLGMYLQNPRGLKKLLIGKPYLQYELLVNKLTCAGSYADGGLKDPRPNINAIEQLLNEIRAQYKTAAFATDIRVLSQLDTVLVKQETAPDLPPLFLNMLKELQSALDNRERLLKEFNNFDKMIVRYIDICLAQLRREQQAYHWTQSYTECSTIAQKDAFSNAWMRMIMGIPWRRVAKHLVWIIMIVLAFIILVRYKAGFLALIASLRDGTAGIESTAEAIWDGALGILAGAFTLIVKDLFGADRK